MTVSIHRPTHLHAETQVHNSNTLVQIRFGFWATLPRLDKGFHGNLVRALLSALIALQHANKKHGLRRVELVAMERTTRT